MWVVRNAQGAHARVWYTAAMRWFLAVMVVVAIGLYSTIGIRLGLLPNIPMTFWNAEGTNTYDFEVRTEGSPTTVFLESDITQGMAEIQFLNPQGYAFFGQQLRGKFRAKEFEFKLNPGKHRVVVKFRKASGFIGLNWQVAYDGRR
jgi:hypothetical protein